MVVQSVCLARSAWEEAGFAAEPVVLDEFVLPLHLGLFICKVEWLSNSTCFIALFQGLSEFRVGPTVQQMLNRL